MLKGNNTKNFKEFLKKFLSSMITHSNHETLLFFRIQNNLFVMNFINTQH